VKFQPYTPPHMAIRLERVKRIWRKEWIAEQNNVQNTVMPRLISFSFGFIAGVLGEGWIFWLFSVLLYFGVFYLLKYLSRVWKINP
jgi:uncharacterized membrane protein YfcA